MKPSTAFVTKSMSHETEAEFTQLAEHYANLWKPYGIHLKAFRSAKPEHFHLASAKVRAAAIGYLRFNIDVLQELIASGETPTDTKVFLWRAVKKLGLIPPSDFLNYISDEDVVELYFFDDIQAFRNYKFLELTSFTIDELLCRPWYRNVKRGWIPTLLIMRTAMQWKLGMLKETIPWNIPVHQLQEIDTACNYRFQMKFKHIIPLRMGSKVVAAVTTNHCKAVG